MEKDDYSIPNSFDDSEHSSYGKETEQTDELLFGISNCIFAKYNENNKTNIKISKKDVVKFFNMPLEVPEDLVQEFYSNKFKFVTDNATGYNPKIVFHFENCFLATLGLLIINKITIEDKRFYKRDWIEEWEEDRSYCTLPELQEMADEALKEIVKPTDKMIKNLMAQGAEELSAIKNNAWFIPMQDMLILPSINGNW